MLKTLWMAVLLLFCCFHVEAGSARASWSRVPGVFLGFAYDESESIEACLEVGQPKAYINGFKDTCAKKQRIWAIGIPNAVECTRFDYVEEAGNGPIYELQLRAQGKRRAAKNAVIFSLRPLSTYQSATRALDATEIQSLLSVYKTNSLKTAVSNAIFSGDYHVLDFKDGSSSVYILKWKHVSEEYSSNDYFLVIDRDGDQFFSAGNFEGSIIGFVDVNNDGIPEVQRSMDCDGTCEAVTSIYKNTDDFVSVYNH